MKTERLALALVFSSIGAIGACSSADMASNSKDSPPSGSMPGPSGSTAAAGSAGSSGSAGGPTAAVDPAAPTSSPSTPGDSRPVSQSGQLTAGTWDDNANFDFYSRYLSTASSSQLPGLPMIERLGRLVLLVQNPAGEPMAGAQVQVSDGAGHVFTSTTGAEGRVLYFPGWDGVAIGTALSIKASLANDVAEASAIAGADTVTLTLAQAARSEVGALDLAFVIDTTGSMTDELSYLQTELDTIVAGISAQFPGLVQRFALIAYRDLGDEYVLRTFDFTSDLGTFRSNLAARVATGGGDTPEAVDQALSAAAKLSWKAGASARVAFWIADAPHHNGLEGGVVSALQTAVSKGVHIYPVAASGIDDLAEFTMRTAAEVTGGRYLFLTDDSGIGNAHAEPHIPCYYVTTLESAIRRMVSTEVSGYYAPPLAAEIIRTSGNPTGQRCELSGNTYTIW
jgi:hypothetical protein